MLERILVATFGGPWRLKTLCQTFRQTPVGAVLKIIYRYYNFKRNSSIAWNSTFHGEPCLPHGWNSIFISGNAIIGENCTIFQQVVIGSNNLADSKKIGAPVIGSDCYIGAGAKIIGAVKIGNNCRIGANTVVYKDVKDNSSVVSSEQINRSSDKPLNNRFYSFRNNKRVYFRDGKWIEEFDPITLKAFSESRNNTE